MFWHSQRWVPVAYGMPPHAVPEDGSGAAPPAAPLPLGPPERRSPSSPARSSYRRRRQVISRQLPSRTTSTSWDNSFTMPRPRPQGCDAAATIHNAGSSGGIRREMPLRIVRMSHAASVIPMCTSTSPPSPCSTALATSSLTMSSNSPMTVDSSCAPRSTPLTKSRAPLALEGADGNRRRKSLDGSVTSTTRLCSSCEEWASSVSAFCE